MSAQLTMEDVLMAVLTHLDHTTVLVRGISSYLMIILLVQVVKVFSASPSQPVIKIPFNTAI